MGSCRALTEPQHRLLWGQPHHQLCSAGKWHSREAHGTQEHMEELPPGTWGCDSQSWDPPSMRWCHRGNISPGCSTSNHIASQNQGFSLISKAFRGFQLLIHVSSLVVPPHNVLHQPTIQRSTWNAKGCASKFSFTCTSFCTFTDGFYARNGHLCVMWTFSITFLLNFDLLGTKITRYQMMTMQGFLPQKQESSLQEEKK